MRRPELGGRAAVLAVGVGLTLGGAAIRQGVGAGAAQEPDGAQAVVAPATDPAKPVAAIPFYAKNNKKFLAVYSRDTDYPSTPKVVGNSATFRTEGGDYYSFPVTKSRRDPKNAKRLILMVRVQVPLLADKVETDAELDERSKALLGGGELVITVDESPPKQPQPLPAVGVDEDPCM